MPIYEGFPIMFDYGSLVFYILGSSEKTCNVMMCHPSLLDHGPTIWLWLSVRKMEAMAHRNRCFTYEKWWFIGIYMGYIWELPSGNDDFSLRTWNWLTWKFVDLPIPNGGSFHNFCVNVYQAGYSPRFDLLWVLLLSSTSVPWPQNSWHNLMNVLKDDAVSHADGLRI